MSNKEISILSIDASTTCTGYTIYSYNPETLDFKHIKTDSIVAKDKGIYQRFNTIHKGFDDLGLYTSHDLAVFENYAFKGNRVTQMAELNGLLKYNFTLNKVPIEVVAISTIKKQITGYGRGSKDKVRSHLKNFDCFNNYRFKNNDESDSAAVGLTYILKDIELKDNVKK